MIVAVASVLDEAPIIARTVTHLLGNGVDKLIVSDGGSTDGTPEILTTLDVTVLEQRGPFDQSEEMTRLALLAQEMGADWVIPFDADEFWIDPCGETIKQILDALPETLTRVYCPTFTQLTWDLMVPAQKLWGKVCFRPHLDMHIAWGNHSVDGVPGDEAHGLLAVRELQYRDFEHFLAKVERSRRLFASWDLPSVYGGHMRHLVSLDSASLEAEYAAYAGLPTVPDPIPYRGV